MRLERTCDICVCSLVVPLRVEVDILFCIELILRFPLKQADELGDASLQVGDGGATKRS
jgi:hypothetical protein